MVIKGNHRILWDDIGGDGCLVLTGKERRRGNQGELTMGGCK